MEISHVGLGESPIALMTRAGHANMNTTKRYLHLAGQTFPEEAAALERRLLGGASTEVSTDTGEPQESSLDPTAVSEPV